MATSAQIGILTVDDHPLLLQGLAFTLSAKLSLDRRGEKPLGTARPDSHSLSRLPIHLSGI